MGSAQSIGVDLGPYLGRWYEVARYPNPFEKDCLSATADYFKIGNQLTVINTCFMKDNKWKQSVGSITSGLDSLWVTFEYDLDPFGSKVTPAFPGQYKILWTDYQNISFVAGGPFYWILSRSPIIDADQRYFISKMTAALGYDVNRLIWVM